MKLQCNVCTESPTIKLPEQPNHIDHVICCPSCDKQLAWASEHHITNKLYWHPVDTDKDKTGYQAVIIID